MARPKQFNRDEALSKAMEVFWTQGFEATTMTQLRHAMGLGRQSLYDTYGDKRALFTEALDRYVARNDASVASILSSADPLAAVRALLDSRVEMLTAGERRGCLMMNSAVELAHHDVAAAVQLRGGLGRMRGLIEDALGRAQDAGQVRRDAAPGAQATFVLAQIAGMVVLAKTGAQKEELEAVADHAMRALV